MCVLRPFPFALSEEYLTDNVSVNVGDFFFLSHTHIKKRITNDNEKNKKKYDERKEEKLVSVQRKRIGY